MSEIIVGLDLGQSIDFSAMAVIEKITKYVLTYRKTEPEITNHLRHLQRWPLGTPYPDIVEQVAKLLTREEFGGRPPLAIDATGLGAVLYDLFKREKKAREDEGKPAYDLFGIKITKEGKVGYDAGHYSVPKVELVRSFFVDYGSERFQAAANLPDRQEFEKQIKEFRWDITPSGHATFGAAPGSHDDYVLAVAMAVWLTKRPSFEYHFYGGSYGDQQARREGSIFELERQMKKNEEQTKSQPSR